MAEEWFEEEADVGRGFKAEVSGVVDSVIFRNDDNAFTIFTVSKSGEERGREQGGALPVTCVGCVYSVIPGENVSVFGDYVTHPVYGRQIAVKRIEKTPPSSLDGIEKYLGSGLIKGVRERTAKKIVQKFKTETLNIIENFPEKLSQIDGITLSKAIAIGETFKEQERQRTAIMYLQEFDVTPAFAIKIFSKYGDGTVEIIKTNPYRLADEMWGVGFKTAEKIAEKVGIGKSSPLRLRAGIKYALSLSVQKGHVFLPRDELLRQSEELLEAEPELVENELLQMQIDRYVWVERLGSGVAAVYLNSYFYAENYVAKRLVELKNGYAGSENPAAWRSMTLESSEIALAENQKEAVRLAASSGVLVITGGPGTGKTTVIKAIIRELSSEGATIELAAPTGKAAKRITEACGRPAKTIHRLLNLGFPGSNGGAWADKSDDEPLECDALIVDEASMVDINLMYQLLKALPVGAKLILVGDADQLPSVGPGNVLRDIISSGGIRTVFLSEIFRQESQSEIITNAHRINRGEYPVLNGKGSDFFLIKKTSPYDALETIVELITERLPKFTGCDGVSDIQVIASMRKGVLGVENLNRLLQERLNPPDRHKREREFRQTVFREGDKVMHVKNNYNLEWRVDDGRGRLLEEGSGVFNGDEGVIQRIREDEGEMTVLFDDSRRVVYKFEQLEELELSYAVTVHKSQGSEYRLVVMPVHGGPPMLLTRNLLYTAVTRAKQLVALVGTREALNMMVDNNREVLRYSALEERIRRADRGYTE